MMSIDQNLCIRCGSCIRTCPAGIFRKEEDGSIAALQQACLNCFHCTAVCPTKAVAHSDLPREELYPAPAAEGTLLAKLQRRHSQRHFKADTPDADVIRTALDYAACCPSAKNQRAVKWTVVLGKEKVDALYRIALGWAKGVKQLRHLVWVDRQGRNPVTCNAPCLVFAHCPEDCSNPAVEASIATAYAEQFLVDSGLGTCWGGYMSFIANNCPELREALGLPANEQIHAMLMVGMPDETFRHVPYRPAASIRWID